MEGQTGSDSFLDKIKMALAHLWAEFKEYLLAKPKKFISSLLEKVKRRLEKAIFGRTHIFKRHFLSWKRWVRRIGLSWVGVGVISFILGVVSVVFNKDLDIIDRILNDILSDLPVVDFLASKETSSQDTYMDEDGNLVMDEGGGSFSDRGRRGGDSGGRSVMSLLKWPAILGLVAIVFLAAVPILGGASGGGVIGDYVGFIGGEAADRQGVSIASSPMLDSARYGISEQIRKARCAMEGPHCLREWRLNNTARPGSESVGQRYGLEIRNFELAQGDSIDIAYKDRDYDLPLSFALYNPRYGFRGIDARNVSYRVQVVDFSTMDEPYCDTGWTPVEGYDVSGAEGKFSGNDLPPGTAAATEFLTHEKLTLENCRMLQPGAGETRTALLQIKYDYFSQATLSFEAMSRQASEGEEPEDKPSVTADTPAKAALSARSPALFDETDPEQDQFIPISATIETEETNTAYQVQDMRVTKPSRTCIAASGGDEKCAEDADEDPGVDYGRRCLFEPVSGGGENELKLNSDAESRLIAGSGNLPDDYWFDRNNDPDMFGCLLNLEPGHGISPSGETLTMHVESNYTVRLEEQIGSFRVFNQRCSRFNCPLVVALNGSEIGDAITQYNIDNRSSDYYWMTERATCSGVDAEDGCAVAKEYTSVDTEFENHIDRGETAFHITGDFIDNNLNHFSCNARKMEESEEEIDLIAGLENREIESVFSDDRQVIDMGYIDEETGEIGYSVITEDECE